MSAAAVEPTIGRAVGYDVRDDVAYVTLDAPPLNILTAAVMYELADAVERAQGDPSCKAIALTSAARVFSAGADVGEHRPEQAPAMIAAFSRLFSVLGASDLPIVAAIDGAALGAGFELALMADVLLASERATFGQPEIRLGFFAPIGVAWLPRLIGAGRALEVTCTGRTYSAMAMHAMGLVSRVLPADELWSALEALLGDIRRASAAVIRLNVRMTRRLMNQPFERGRREAERAFVEELMKLDDVQEGIAAFFEKRKPCWTNR